MAINTVSVVGPRAEAQKQEKEKKDPLDMILQGLQIAQGVTGIAVNYQTIRQKMAERELQADELGGIQQPKDQQQALASGLQPVEKGTPGSVVQRYRTGEGDEGVKEQAFILPKAKTEEQGSVQKVYGDNDSPVLRFVTGKEETPYRPYIEPKESGGITNYREDSTGDLWGFDKSGRPKKIETGGVKFGKARDPQDDKLARELADKINPSRGRSGELGKIQARLNSADRVLGLALDENGQPKALTKGEMTELASSVASMISNGGVASQHVIDTMTPQSMAGDFSQQWSYLTNEVKPADMTAFVGRLAHTAERERDISSQQKLQAQAQTVSSYHDLREREPELWARIVKSSGLNPEDFDENSLYTPKQKETAPKKLGGDGQAVAGPGGKAEKPKTVIQNGHTYKLNEKTGEYE